MAGLTPGQIVNTLAPIVGRVGAAGIAGNLQQESSDNPASAGGGLAQWQGDRYAGLVKYAQSRGLPTGSPQAALGYLAQDLKGPYSGLAQQLRGANNPAHAATLFSNIYERPGTPMLGNRIAYAQQAFGAKGGQVPGGLGGSARAQTSSRQVPVTTTGFNQAGFQRASQKAIAGEYLAGQSAASDPYAAGQPKTGLSTAGSSNPLISLGVLPTQAPNPAAYRTAQTTLQRIAGASTPLNQHPAAFHASLKGSGYTNPLPGATWERTDMGVDASMKPGAPIRALGDSRVVNIQPNWYQGQPKIVFQLTSGPQAGKFYYVAEAINSNVRPGQRVRAGQTIGTYNAGGTGLELGWNSGGGATLAQASGNTGDASHGNAPAGVAFRNFLHGIGAGV